mmetsp:Transcript_129121/g.413814  ORF Transcript_129121/g.413814 Transcript_129121/m.413814 type:complete len:311 (+) Transcript_129121:713-1645(+)
MFDVPRRKRETSEYETSETLAEVADKRADLADARAGVRGVLFCTADDSQATCQQLLRMKRPLAMQGTERLDRTLRGLGVPGAQRGEFRVSLNQVPDDDVQGREGIGYRSLKHPTAPLREVRPAPRPPTGAALCRGPASERPPSQIPASVVHCRQLEDELAYASMVVAQSAVVLLTFASHGEGLSLRLEELGLVEANRAVKLRQGLILVHHILRGRLVARTRSLLGRALRTCGTARPPYQHLNGLLGVAPLHEFERHVGALRVREAEELGVGDLGKQVVGRRHIQVLQAPALRIRQAAAIQQGLKEATGPA